MKTELIIKTEDQAFLDAIKNTGKSWHEVQLPDHPDHPLFSRKIVVTGFNTPDMNDDEEDRIYVYVTQYLIRKEGGQISKKIKMKDWFINENNVEDVMGSDGVLKGIRTMTDDEGNIISEVEEVLTVNSVQYVRFLVKNKHLHIVDVLQRFMGLYIQLFEKEINNI